MPRLVKIAGPALLLVVALLSLLIALRIGGGADAPVLADPGVIVRFGLPIAQLFFNIGAAGTIGALVLTCFALDAAEPEFNASLDFAAGAAAFWTIAAGVTGFLTFMNVYLQPITFDDSFSQLFGSYLTSIPIGQAALFSTLVPAVVTVLCFAVRNRTGLFFVTILAGVGLIPMALQGHAAGTAGHDQAVSSFGLHVVFAAVWLGGLLTLVATRRTLEGGRIGPVLSRYSSLALMSFVIVAATGIVNASLRVGSFENLATPYGILVIIKVLALGALGVFGAVQRRFLIGRMQEKKKGGRAYFWWFVAAELAFMGLASGVAAALARTRTPIPQELITTTPALILTGEPLPPELTPIRFITEWKFDILWMVIIGLLAFFYIAGVWRLHRRGDTWPILRTTFFLVGLAALFYITNGGVNVYEKYLFSAHMLAHMMLGMAIPLLLVPGAPVTLALRAIRKRTDGSRGTREWILIAVHSRLAGIFARPVVAAVFFTVSLWAFYYSPVFRWAAEDHIGHTFMIAHFLLSGYLLVLSLIGIDPMPYKAPYAIRLLVLLGTMAFHAFFGLTMMMGTSLLAADWYGAMGRTWGPSAIVDQQTGGGIAWSIGEIPTLVLAIAVVIMWARSDSALAKRLDRKADRDGDTELTDYNEMLAELQKQP
ncbi:MAG: bifunctional copper resistance protein CopD/cytochrome c oxidase assembly protein [Microbacteriaceae bacterium]|nr:bifunctional copper resistance protein CopD/cytochrome c oxidase assembly protein [Microbacteriaceae bacterium]